MALVFFGLEAMNYLRHFNFVLTDYFPVCGGYNEKDLKTMKDIRFEKNN